ncbi:uncharacterized protein F4807DRAFT_463912 [Annulohypoxylon truncatum]|uniref:uncharacterized protein n=1 Tax=Annulohypoxylon truncatum TaxID=327061 RepID=UPI002008DA91|nr:uncharacterized protein F4807DRAFT_463912 [Annulohypoxylon truncatum]KAI1206147.1 hypothetical protein F4807DRAFT_463912 [Annulohypoxylon truncatum]
MKSKLKDKLPASSSFEFLTYDPSAPLQPPPDLSVKKDAFWSYCGPLLTSEGDLPPSLHDWAEAVLRGSLLPLLLPFLAFVNEFLAAEGLDHYWLTIRATKATSEFDQPRWHTDDLFFSRGGSGLREPPSSSPSSTTTVSSTPSQSALSKKIKTKTKKPQASTLEPSPQLDLQTTYKLCTTLLGPSTLFIPSPSQALARRTSHTTKRTLTTPHPCTSLRCLACASTSESVRASLARSLAKLGQAQARAGQAALFRIGSEEGAVHSEPALGGGDRVFVNVVPGKRAELAGLVRRWGMSFPRSWWIAPGVGREGR